MNHRVLLLLLLVYGLILTALLSQNGSVALMTLPFLAYLGVGLLQSPVDVHLSATRMVSKPSSTANSPLDVILKVQNEGENIPCLYINDRIAEQAEVTSGAAVAWAALPAQSTLELSYTFQIPRGCYTWEELLVETSDPFGLFVKQVALPLKNQVLVHPDWKKLRRISLLPRHTQHTPGQIPAHLAGSGTNFWGVREYQPGDPLRWINWRMSARHPGSFFTTEFEREEIANIGLILDARKLTDLHNHGQSLFEYSVQAAASLAEAFLKGSNKVGLLVLGGSFTYLYPSNGKKQFRQILNLLAKAQTGDTASLLHLRYVSKRMFPAKSLLVVISPLSIQDTLAFNYLKSMGYQVLLLSPDPVAFSSQGLKSDGLDALARRTARLERKAQLGHLRQMGIDVVEWPVSQALARTIHAARLQRRARNG